MSSSAADELSTRAAVVPARAWGRGDRRSNPPVAGADRETTRMGRWAMPITDLDGKC